MIVSDAIRRLLPTDAQAVFNLFKEVFDNTPPGFLSLRNLEEISTAVDESGASVGYFKGGQLGAYSLGFITDGNVSCPVCDLGITTRPEQPIGISGGTVIHPDFQGRGVHSRLYTARIDLLKIQV